MTKKTPLVRCQWVDMKKPLYVEYHDKEWGVPVHDDRKIFEFLILESAQAGLSWYTILSRRENYRKAFSHFNPEKIARFTEKKIDALMNDAGIIRNRKKILAAINNARCFLNVQDSFESFNDYIWRFVDGKPIVNRFVSIKEIPTTSPESDKLTKDMKQRGFSFIGSTIIYAHMQATGMVNDHTIDCFRHDEIMNLSTE